MKKNILFYFLVGTFFSQAQILNPGFESVTSGKPDNWNTNFYSSYYIKDTSAAHTGSHAAYIKGFGGQSYAVQGAVLGTFPTTVTGRPIALTGWYKCGLQAGDSLVFNPYVYHTTINSPYLPAYAYTTTSTAVYKQFSAAFNYPAIYYDTLATLFVSVYLSGLSKDSANFFIPKTGTWAIIDDLSFTYPADTTVVTGIKNLTATAQVESIYPQPATETAFVIYSLSHNAVCSLELMDITGKSVQTVLLNEKQTPGRYKAEINLTNLSSGMYLVKLKTGAGETHVSKLIKQ